MPTSPAKLRSGHLTRDKVAGQRIGNNIRVLRRAKGLSGRNLASSLGVSHECVYRWERNLSTPPPNRLEAVAALLDISATNLSAKTYQLREPTEDYVIPWESEERRRAATAHDFLIFLWLRRIHLDDAQMDWAMDRFYREHERITRDSRRRVLIAAGRHLDCAMDMRFMTCVLGSFDFGLDLQLSDDQLMPVHDHERRCIHWAHPWPVFPGKWSSVGHCIDYLRWASGLSWARFTKKFGIHECHVRSHMRGVGIRPGTLEAFEMKLCLPSGYLTIFCDVKLAGH